MKTSDLPRHWIDTAAQRSITNTRMRLRDTMLDPGLAPATLQVVRLVADLPKPGDDLDKYIDEVVAAVGAAQLGRYDEGNPNRDIPGIELIPGRPATRNETAPLKIAALARIAAFEPDLRHTVKVLAAMQRGDVRGFGAKTYRFVDLDGDSHTLHVVCTGWDPDADRAAVNQFPAELDLVMVLAERSELPPPVIDSPTFVLGDRPEGGWRLKSRQV